MASSSKALSNIGPKIWEAIMESPDDYWSQFQDLTKPTTIKETEHLHYEFQSFTTPNSQRPKGYNMVLQANSGSKIFKKYIRMATHSKASFIKSTPTLITLLAAVDADLSPECVKAAFEELCKNIEELDNKVSPKIGILDQSGKVVEVDLQAEKEEREQETLKTKKNTGKKGAANSQHK